MLPRVTVSCRARNTPVLTPCVVTQGRDAIVFIVMGVFAHWEQRIIATTDEQIWFLIAELSCTYARMRAGAVRAIGLTRLVVAKT